MFHTGLLLHGAFPHTPKAIQAQFLANVKLDQHQH
jgi:hypothetical protein